MLLRKSRQGALAFGLAAAMLAAMAPAAVAAPPVANGTAEDVTGAGSDTSVWVMEGISRAYNVDNKAGAPAYNTDVDRAIHIASQVNPDPALGTNGFSSDYDVPAQGACPGIHYSASGTLPPNGSSAGLTQLNGANGTNGCIDYARSSRASNGSVAENADQFFAFATDAVAVIGFAANIKGKLNFTKADLTNIYTCDPGTGLPFYTNWNQVPGTNGVSAPIKRYAPQASSGTRSFFSSKMLNAPLDTNCTTPATQIEENDAAAVASADRPNAIFIYSLAQYTSQTKSVTPNLLAKAKIMQFEGLKPTAANISETGAYGARRYVYNVVRPGTPNYDAAVQMVGATANPAGGNGYICSNKAAKVIAAFGFKALPKSSGPSTNLGGLQTYCRLNPPAL